MNTNKLKLGICAIIKDEHRYLQEWLDYNFAIGFDKIYLFEDFDSVSHHSITDSYGSKVKLKPISACGIHSRKFLGPSKDCLRQLTLYRWFCENYDQELDWCAFIDVDEYIATDGTVQFRDFIEEHCDWPGLYLYWKTKGASGYIDRPKGGVVESYTEDAKLLDSDEGWDYKSIVNLKKYSGFNTIHEANGLYNTMGLKTERIRCHRLMWINHYFTKSWEDWCGRFFKRGDLVWGHRRIEHFFEINPKLRDRKNELVDFAVEHYVRPFAKEQLTWKTKITSGLWGIQVAKCGLTSISVLGNTYYKQNPGEHYTNKPVPWNPRYVVDVSVKTDGVTFVIYRDPIKRWCSFYKNKIVNGYPGSPFVDFLAMQGKSVEEILTFTETELTYHRYDTDGHIALQSDYYTIDDVDYIVPIEHFAEFLVSQGVEPIEPQNCSGDYHIVLTQEQENRLKAIYEEDYKLLDRFKDKIWKPSDK